MTVIVVPAVETAPVGRLAPVETTPLGRVALAVETVLTGRISGVGTVLTGRAEDTIPLSGGVVRWPPPPTELLSEHVHGLGVPVAAVSHAGLDGYTARLGRLTIARRRPPPSRRRRPRSSRNEHRATRCGLRGPVENQLGHETLERLHGSVPGVYTLYNVMPSESDANEAASSFARRMFGSDAWDRLPSAGVVSVGAAP